ncbi:glycosyl hydrolase family 8 [Actinoplanes sichuanensis]|uniref:Glucanase n=1 Tax=Actinoplanes sichuanensis TaxID=512349 RepID=A0ABW4AC15_9ACTN|nr:glycosyl hydrolase family 8 [Actinoplanes sichuanensis]BEL05292.1 glycosyl hydrolase family 8 [Actinoplanes sichuanensis]
MIRWPFVRTVAAGLLILAPAGCDAVATMRVPVSPGFYPHDVIRPSAGRAVMRERLVAYYRQWRAAFVRPGCGDGTLRIHSPDAAYPAIAEAQGYGLVIAASMASLDADARRLFDGILGFVLAHPSSNDADLMAAELDARCVERDGGDSATDGDLDIAYALLLADRTWGSTGTHDYRGLALRRIAAVKRSNVNRDSSLLLLGDWSTPGSPLYGTSRTSDWNPVYFRAFRAVTGDPAWTEIAAAHRAAVDRLQRSFSPRTGLMPDFVRGTGVGLTPVAGRVLETAHDGDFGFNACRTPWRLGLDALLSGDAVSTAAARRMTGWFRSVTGGDPGRIGSGYTLAGTAYRAESDNAFWAPLAVAAMADPDAQQWLDALWQRLATAEVDPGDYFGDTLQLQVMIVVSGNYPLPA